MGKKSKSSHRAFQKRLVHGILVLPLVARAACPGGNTGSWGRGQGSPQPTPLTRHQSAGGQPIV